MTYYYHLKIMENKTFVYEFSENSRLLTYHK
jgi:hypothetical protein